MTRSSKSMSNNLSSLREKAEKILKEKTEKLAHLSARDFKQLVQELATYQSELEMKNEELRRVASFPQLNPNPVLEVNSSGEIMFRNEAATRILRGLNQTEDLGLFLPDDIGTILKSLEQGKDNLIYREVKIKERIFEEHIHFVPAFDSLRIYARDITGRRREEERLYKLNSIFKARSDSNFALTHVTDEPAYLHEICKIIVKDCGHAMVWIGFAEEDEGKTVRPLAYEGFEEGYLETLKITWADTERGRGPTGTAIRTGKPTVCRNMLTDPSFKPWREQAIKRGYASSLVLPLLADGKAFGAVTIYSKQPDSFFEDEIELLMELANDIAHGVMTLRLRAAHAQAEEEVRRSNSDLQQFAYAASHDLQEPLRGIAGFAGLLEKRYKGKFDRKADEFIDYIIDDVKRMQALINDLLEYSRIEAKGKVFKATNCSVALEEAFYNLRSVIEETAADITYDLLPTVMADAPQLKRLFQNLIGNAIKFRGKERPRIHISAERKENNWVFSVKDNGIGFDVQFADRIFVVFQRLHARQEYPGTGIGLAICKKIVEHHGGHIWVESEPGNGSTFYFTIPAA